MFAVLGVFALVSAIGGPASGSPTRPRPPTAGSVHGVTVDLGPQLPGQVVDGRVLIRNRGPATVRFSKIIASCGCLHSDLRHVEKALRWDRAGDSYRGMKCRVTRRYVKGRSRPQAALGGKREK